MSFRWEALRKSCLPEIGTKTMRAASILCRHLLLAAQLHKAMAGYRLHARQA